ncbi:glycosyl transferase group 1 [Stanieria cyanosphaera PCC 7437]|uniref:Glycosyl transferase group 1 n=1 Tax=Stanieria cyanosphaera (strain ATCC 29371 / PCC 7437) TaxID=111780 RepID=K9XTJ7_STAC7|nr:glycosyltransferase [Stanieria cyanosphaera]AFZ35406.1 glycosyl transferase group 1 [Stanieria cyanosphaera PCC 7437]
MKIAFVAQPWSFARPIIGCDSLGIWTYQVARRLNNSTQVLYYGLKDNNYPSVYQESGIEYHGISSNFDKYLKIFRILDRWQITSPQRPFFASRLYGLGYIYQVAKSLQKEQCDLIHIHNFSQFAPIIKAFNPHSKIVLHMHCEWLNQLNWEMINRRLQYIDLVISCSDYLTEKSSKRFSHLDNRFQTVYNGVDTTLFTNNYSQNQTQDYSSKKNKNILFVGRISPEKGIHILVDAFKQVVKQHPNTTLTIAGPKAIVCPEFLVRLDDNPKVQNLIRFYQKSQDYFEYIQSQIEPEIADKNQFTGPLNQLELVDYYRQADLVINPSLSEAFGMSLVEAMAMEIAVIGAKAGGMPNVIEEGKVGLLAESADTESLVQAILQLLQNEDTCKAMGKAGRQRVLKLFCWDRVTENLLDIYQNLLQHG